MSLLKEILRPCAIVAALLAAVDATAATVSQIDAAQLNGLKWLLTKQDGEGDWPSPAGGVVTTTSAIDALSQAGINGFPYSRGISWLANTAAASTDAMARQTITLYKAGVNTSTLVSRLISLRNDSTLSWGSYDHYAGSFPDTSLALDAVKITGTVYSSTNYGLGYIVSQQNIDSVGGGWPYTRNDTNSTATQSRIVPTAYNILTLNRYKSAYLVQTNIDNGINWLKSQQKSGGGFGDGATGTVLETALAYQAIVAEKGTGDSAALLALDFLIQQQSADGSWGADAFTTAQVLLTLPATVLADTDKDGIPDEIEVLMLKDPNKPDSRWLATGNGDSVPGVTTPTVLNNTSVVNQPFGFTLAGIGTGPFTWKITTGALPPGLSLGSANGVISGTATSTGSYSFEYTVTDANGVSSIRIAQIDILSPIVHDGDLNGDGVVNVVDVLLAERIAMGLLIPTAEQQIRCDVAPVGNPNGVINVADVLLIARKALGFVNY